MAPEGENWTTGGTDAAQMRRGGCKGFKNGGSTVSVTSLRDVHVFLAGTPSLEMEEIKAGGTWHPEGIERGSETWPQTRTPESERVSMITLEGILASVRERSITCRNIRRDPFKIVCAAECAQHLRIQCAIACTNLLITACTTESSKPNSSHLGPAQTRRRFGEDWL